MTAKRFLCKNNEIFLDKWGTNAYNSQADMALKASWTKPDAIGGRENNV